MTECARVLDGRLSKRCGRLVLLPIPTTRDNKYISGSDTSIDGVGRLLTSGTTLAGYSVPPMLCRAAEEVGCLVYDGALDEDFLIANAELTARGAVGYILTNSKKDLSDMRVGVVGYGRIGMRLTSWLLRFGSHITVYTNRPEVAAELWESGVSAELMLCGCDFSTLDLLINTAPARQIDEGRLPRELKIIDLASGNIFTPSDRLTKLPSIPELYYPITAGRLYADAILRSIGEENI